MYGVPQANRQALIDLGKTRTAVYRDPRVHQARVKRELRGAGIRPIEMLRGECRYLPTIIHYDEHIGGAVMGKHESGKVLLAATDKRIIFLDNKPFYVTEDEISFDSVGGIELGHVGMSSTVTLHTRVKDYKVRTMNCRAADNFARFIELRSLEHASQRPPGY